ncbi:MAG: hypothetical protein Q7J25_04765 [Vicinamibacterales bacterium]|nr:hypothetical protein [Vicinamibacterales bacterium]
MDTKPPIAETPIQEPSANLERQLISAYVAGAGHELESLLTRDDAAARELLTQASQYASERLSEVESRVHYLHNLRGQG